jgi:cob(I)alamin adenosyltransferase
MLAAVSIVTKSGDSGSTSLMFNRRVSKNHPRVEACGSVDELNASLGLARATARHALVQERLLAIQRDLVVLMGELATLPEDLPRYVTEGYPAMTAERTARIDEWVRHIEAQGLEFKGWAMPGADPHSAAIELARATCRRAERRVCALQDAGELRNPEIIIFLNRLADALWLLARWVEAQPG